MTKLKNSLSYGGIIKIALDRFRVYVTYVQLAMIAALYFDQEGWQWWYLLFIPVSCVVIYFDIRYLYRGEQQAAFDVHPYMPQMRDDIKEIKARLNGLSDLQKKS